MSQAVLTERQKKWFATVRANLETQTGRTLEQWTQAMAACPHAGTKAQAAWLKSEHGVGANHAAHILSARRSGDGPGWDQPEALRAALWKDAGSLAILAAVEGMAARHTDVISGQRKGYTSFSRAIQFAALRPLKGGRALLGLKLDPAASPRLASSSRRESWSERLIAVMELHDASAVDADLVGLFARAAENG